MFDHVSHRKWFRVLSFILNTRLYAIMKSPHLGYGYGCPAKLCHYFTTTYCVECFGEVAKGHVEFQILILTFLLKFSCCKDHVYGVSVFPESILTFWYKPSLIKMTFRLFNRMYASIQQLKRGKCLCGCHRHADFLSVCIDGLWMQP